MVAVRTWHSFKPPERCWVRSPMNPCLRRSKGTCSKRSGAGARPVRTCNARPAFRHSSPTSHSGGSDVSKEKDLLRLLLRFVGWSGLLAMAAGLTLTASASSDVVGHVYVNDNTAGTNTIAGFDRHSDGSLTPIAGAPFSAGGRGTGTIVGSQGALQLSGDGRYLLAVDAGSNQISVLRVLPGGGLRRVGRPVSSGG